MIFKSEPGHYVRIANKYVQRATGKKGFYFDANGEYATDNELLIKLLSPHFAVKEEPQEEAEKPGGDAQAPCFPCPHCSFVAANPGGLTSHIRAKHKGEGA